MATAPPKTIAFGELIRRLVLVEKRRPAAAVAAALGLTPASFYRRLNGHARFDPDQIALLLRELDDHRLHRWLFGGTKLLPVLLTSALQSNPAMTSFERTTAAAEATIKALLHILAVFDPDQPDGEAGQATESLIDDAAAALLSVKLESMAGQRITPPANHNMANGGFGPLVGQILLAERGGNLSDLATSLGLGYHALRERLTGRARFTPDELRRLLRLHPEPRLADYLLRGTPYIAVPMPVADDAQDSSGPIEAGLLSLRRVITLLGVFRRLLDDPQATPPQVIAHEIDAALRHLVSLQWSTRYIGRQVDRQQRHRLGDRVSDVHGGQAAGTTVRSALL